jgi:exonuclease SbcC
MSLFDSIRIPKWQHSNPQVRLQSVTELSDQAILAKLVVEDSDPTVQAAALARITDAATLDALLGSKLPSALLGQARLQRLRQLVPMAGELPTALAGISDEASLLHIIRLSDDASLVEAAIDRLTREQVRVELAQQHPLARVRLYAAQGIRDLQVLGELMQYSKGRDKAVFRHCKHILDEVHARDRHVAAQQDKVKQLLVRMAELSHSVDSPGYEGQYRSLVMQWQEVEVVATAGEKATFQHDQAICGQRLIALREEVLEAKRIEADVQAAQGELQAVLADLAAFDANPPGDTSAAGLQEISDALAAFETRWRTAQVASQAPASLASAFAARLRDWRNRLAHMQNLAANEGKAQALLDESTNVDAKDYALLERQHSEVKRFLASVQWPQATPLQAPEVYTRLQRSLETLDGLLRTLDQQQQALAAQCKELTSALVASLENQQPAEADRSLAKVRRLLASLAPKRRNQVEQSLAPLVARLREFHDWQNFAIEPKKQNLVERMSALIGSQDEVAADVELLALNIQSLQNEWKQLGPLPQAREKQLWTKFKAAADEAWKPCAAEFSRQGAIRQQNFAERMKLVKQLQDYEARMNWPGQAEAVDAAGESTAVGPAPDWPKVQHTLDTARAAFRSLAPVDPKAERTSQKAFREICDRIYAHIHLEYQTNISRKEALATRARGLAGQDDLSQAIDAVKRLQSEWKAVGATPVAADRKLWKDFRGSCDAVFARLDQQRAEQKSAAESQVRQAESLRDQARAMLQNPQPENLAQLPKAIAELKSAMLMISLPGPVQQRLGKDFQALEAQARELVGRARSQREQASWSQLASAMQAAASSAAGEEYAAISTDELPKGIDGKGIAAFLQQGADAAADPSCREACIALEVLGEIESPAEDKAARMRYQLNRLAAGIGNRVVDPQQAMLSQVNAFIALRPSLPFVLRFCAGLEKIRR